MASSDVIKKDTISFSIESRVLRELGERLVKQPEVALVELIKNSYDADATECSIVFELGSHLTVTDDGHGMTFEHFRNGWMRIGTSSKEQITLSPKYGRLITGEKGIGRFAVRFLGRKLILKSVAYDPARKHKTELVATFDWPKFDRHEDLGKVKVPYTLSKVSSETKTTTELAISKLRSEVEDLDLKGVRTGTMGMLTPLRSLFRERNPDVEIHTREGLFNDPGFTIDLQVGEDEDSEDLASAILENYVLRSQLKIANGKVDLRVFAHGRRKPVLKIVDRVKTQLRDVYADIRFFPRRPGAFRGLPVDGRRAYTWIQQHAGVAIFDRNFRVTPYGSQGDDWLYLTRDRAKSARDPRSSIAEKHFAMSKEVRSSTSENWMLKLPQSAQLVGLVQVEGKRTGDLADDADDEGLIASADREGFVENKAFEQLRDLIRGAVEAIAVADKVLQQERVETERLERLAAIKDQAQAAINQVQSNPNIRTSDKAMIVSALAETQIMAEKQDEVAKERERQLEVMSLLGVVAGFMTHEFGAAIKELEEAHKELVELAKNDREFSARAQSFKRHIDKLREFATYSSGYVQGAKTKPSKPYKARPRLQRVKRYFGQYAKERGINVDTSGVEEDLFAPLVPAALYDGIALNLYTNALKAVTSSTSSEKGEIAFRAWNEGRRHFLEVSDNGVGIPDALTERVFDPLFTTTEARNDPLGSGMGLGLSLVKRGAQAFGGAVELVNPPPGFSTCFRVRIPMGDAA